MTNHLQCQLQFETTILFTPEYFPVDVIYCTYCTWKVQIHTTTCPSVNWTFGFNFWINCDEWTAVISGKRCMNYIATKNTRNFCGGEMAENL